MSLIGCASGKIAAQQPSRSSIRLAAAAMADARVSLRQTPAGAASMMVTLKCGAEDFSATAVAMPT
jgi:hypothetical protein